MDYSPPGSSVHGILQARTMEWVALSFSRGLSRPIYIYIYSHTNIHFNLFVILKFSLSPYLPIYVSICLSVVVPSLARLLLLERDGEQGSGLSHSWLRFQLLRGTQ